MSHISEQMSRAYDLVPQAARFERRAATFDAAGARRRALERSAAELGMTTEEMAAIASRVESAGPEERELIREELEMRKAIADVARAEAAEAAAQAAKSAPEADAPRALAPVSAAGAAAPSADDVFASAEGSRAALAGAGESEDDAAEGKADHGRDDELPAASALAEAKLNDDVEEAADAVAAPAASASAAADDLQSSSSSSSRGGFMRFFRSRDTGRGRGTGALAASLAADDAPVAASAAQARPASAATAAAESKESDMLSSEPSLVSASVTKMRMDSAPAGSAARPASSSSSSSAATAAPAAAPKRREEVSTMKKKVTSEAAEGRMPAAAAAAAPSKPSTSTSTLGRLFGFGDSSATAARKAGVAAPSRGPAAPASAASAPAASAPAVSKPAASKSLRAKSSLEAASDIKPAQPATAASAAAARRIFLDLDADADAEAAASSDASSASEDNMKSLRMSRAVGAPRLRAGSFLMPEDDQRRREQALAQEQEQEQESDDASRFGLTVEELARARAELAGQEAAAQAAAVASLERSMARRSSYDSKAADRDDDDAGAAGPRAAHVLAASTAQTAPSDSGAGVDAASALGGLPALSGGATEMRAAKASTTSSTSTSSSSSSSAGGLRGMLGSVASRLGFGSSKPSSSTKESTKDKEKGTEAQAEAAPAAYAARAPGAPPARSLAASTVSGAPVAPAAFGAAAAPASLAPPPPAASAASAAAPPPPMAPRAAAAPPPPAPVPAPSTALPELAATEFAIPSHAAGAAAGPAYGGFEDGLIEAASAADAADAAAAAELIKQGLSSAASSRSLGGAHAALGALRFATRDEGKDDDDDEEADEEDEEAADGDDDADERGSLGSAAASGSTAGTPARELVASLSAMSHRLQTMAVRGSSTEGHGLGRTASAGSGGASAAAAGLRIPSADVLRRMARPASVSLQQQTSSDGASSVSSLPPPALGDTASHSPSGPQGSMFQPAAVPAAAGASPVASPAAPAAAPSAAVYSGFDLLDAHQPQPDGLTHDHHDPDLDAKDAAVRARHAADIAPLLAAAAAGRSRAGSDAPAAAAAPTYGGMLDAEAVTGLVGVGGDDPAVLTPSSPLSPVAASAASSSSAASLYSPGDTLLMSESAKDDVFHKSQTLGSGPVRGAAASGSGSGYGSLPTLGAEAPVAEGKEEGGSGYGSLPTLGAEAASGLSEGKEGSEGPRYATALPAGTETSTPSGYSSALPAVADTPIGTAASPSSASGYSASLPSGADTARTAASPRYASGLPSTASASGDASPAIDSSADWAAKVGAQLASRDRDRAFAVPLKERIMHVIPARDVPEESTRLTVYAPLAVAPSAVFKVTVHMFLPKDERDVRDVAASGGHVHRGTALRDFRVRRGALVSVMLYLNHSAFELADEPTFAFKRVGKGKGMDAGPSEGKEADREEESSQQHKSQPRRLAYIQEALRRGQRVGVSTTRKLVMRPDDAPAPTPAPGPAPTSTPSPVGPPASRARPDAVSHFAWDGRPESVAFHVRARAGGLGGGSPATLYGSYPCYVRALSGSRSITFRFQLTIEPVAKVLQTVGRAAAAAASIQRRAAAGGEAAVSSVLLSRTWEMKARGMHGEGVPEEGEGEGAFAVIAVGAGKAGLTHTGDEGAPDGVDAETASSGADADGQQVDVVVEATSKALHLPRSAVSDWAVQLARGGHGEVLLSGLRDHTLAGASRAERVVVLKRPLVDAHSAGDSVVRAFKHEAAVQAELGQHPNLVQPLGLCIDEDPSNLFLALEYCPLGSLRGALDRHYGSSPAAGFSAAIGSGLGGPSGSAHARRVWDVATSRVLDAASAARARGIGAGAGAGQHSELLTSCGRMPLASYLDRAQSLLDSGASSAFSFANVALCTQIARDAAAGVAALHAAGFIHRDIACRNVLLTLDETPIDVLIAAASGDVAASKSMRAGIAAKVSDVGLAMRLGVGDSGSGDSNDHDGFGPTQMGQSAAPPTPQPLSPYVSANTPGSASSAEAEVDGYGTPQWMAPEALRFNVASQASDVYMLGATLYELLSGQEPWAELGGDRAKIYTSLLREYRAHKAGAASKLGGHDYGLVGRLLKARQAAGAPALPDRLLDVLRSSLSYEGVFEDLIPSASTAASSASAFDLKAPADADEIAADDALLARFVAGDAGVCRPSAAFICQQLDMAVLEAGSVL